MAIVAVQDFRREEKDNVDDLLNKVAKGLQIAQTIYGLRLRRSKVILEHCR